MEPIETNNKAAGAPFASNAGLASCACGRPLNPPALWVGYTDKFVPVALFTCTCGRLTQAQIETMKPYIAARSETFPPGQGEYHVAPDGVLFTCPVCQAMSPIRTPTHSIDGAGAVQPSVVCPNGCGFHTMMTLKDWKAANVMPKTNKTAKPQLGSAA